MAFFNCLIEVSILLGQDFPLKGIMYPQVIGLGLELVVTLYAPPVNMKINQFIKHVKHAEPHRKKEYHIFEDKVLEIKKAKQVLER